MYHIEALEELFTDVQMNRIFPDSKTFTDAVPKSTAHIILDAYRSEKTYAAFDLLGFVKKHFELPRDTDIQFVSDISRRALHPSLGFTYQNRYGSQGNKNSFA